MRFIILNVIFVQKIKMKKTKLALLLLSASALLYSCSKKDILNDKIPVLKDSKKVAYNGDGKWDLLGFGFDCTGPMLDIDNASDAPIIDMDRFNSEQPNRIAPQTGGIGTSRLFSGSDYFEYLRDVTTSFDSTFKLEGETPKQLYTGTFKSSNQQVDFYTSKYSYATFESVRRIKRIKFNADVPTELLIQYLSPGFLSNVQNLSAENLVQLYGTHLLTDITLGGRLTFHHKASVINESIQENKTRSIAAGIAFAVSKTLGLNVSGNWSSTEKTKALTENTNREFDLKFYGGNTSGLSVTIDANANISQSVNIGTWEQSVTVNNCVLADIGGSIPLYDLIVDPLKKASIKAAVDKRINDSQIQILQLKPLFKVHSAGDKNTMFVTSKAEVDNLVNNWGNQYQGMIGYIAANSGTGMIPLHSMKSLGDKNNFFLTNQHDVDEHVVRWNNIHYGIVGYAFPQSPGLLPLHQVKSDGDKNTMYVTSQQEVDYLVNTWKNRFEGTIGYIIKP